MNELTVWNAALSARCVKTFADKRSCFLHVDVIEEAEAGDSAADEEDKG